MTRIGTAWDPDEWFAALKAGEARRLQERFDKDAADAKRRAVRPDIRPPQERWAEEFCLATLQRTEQQRQAQIRAATRQRAVPVGPHLH